MKLLLKNSFIFLSLPLLGLVILFCLDYDKEFAWNFIEKDCQGQGKWIYSRIHKNPQPVDVAFIGSSLTFAAISDYIVEKKFKGQTQLDWHFANFGYCRLGRNLNYVLLKELLEEKSVKHIILEIRYDENLTGHPMFPYLADSESILKTTLFVNHKIFSDVCQASISRIEYWKQQLFYEKKQYEVNEHPYAFAYLQPIADSTSLENFRQKIIKNHQQADRRIFRKINMLYPRYYLKKISQLCEENNAELSFLYTPSFGEIEFLPKEMETYKKYGKIFIPSPDIYNAKSHWADEVHFNISGAKLHSQWFAEIFASYLESKQ